MANKREITVELNLTTKIDEALKRINALSGELDKFSLKGSVSNEFKKLFSDFEKAYDKIQSKTADGQVNLVDAKEVAKQIDVIDKLYAQLITKLEGKGVKTSLLEKDQKAIDGLNLAIKSYANTTKNISTEQAKLTSQLEKQKKLGEEIEAKENSKKVVEEQQYALMLAKNKALQDQQKTANKALKVAQKGLDEKIVNSGGKYTKEQITEKGSPLRKTDAYKEFKNAAEQALKIEQELKASQMELAKTTTQAFKDEAIKKQTVEITKAEKALEDFNKEEDNVRVLNEAFEELVKQYSKLTGTSLDKARAELNELNKVDPAKTVKGATDALEKFEVAAKRRGANAANEFTINCQQMQSAADGLKEGFSGTTEALEAINEKAAQKENIAQSIKQFIGWTGAARLLSASLRNAYADIKELDAAMTEIAVVTDFEVGDMWEQMPEYTKRANELGVSITEAYEASALFYQQGLDTNEMVALSNETLKMARIAGLDATEATDRMTAALRGFNMELNQANAQNVADVYSKLAAITASDVNEISNAMTKTASIASSAGMEFETTAAFLSQIIETTRESAETAGTAMKTVIARFQELKKDPAEIGEVDGEVVDANKIETALRSVGVSLREANGQFRELDDVFLELSSKWSGLDKNTQRYIATIAAGSRQQSRFIAMMSDYERTQDLVTAANNSAGASQQQYEKTLDSIETKLAKLDNAWTEFSTGIMNSDLIKFGVDFLTSILNILNKITSSTNGFFNSFKKLGMIISLFKLGKALFDKFGNTIIEKITTVGERMGLGLSKGFEDKLMPTLDKIAKDTKGKVSSMSAEELLNENRKNNKEVEKEQGKKKGGIRNKPIIGSIIEGVSQNREARQEISDSLNKKKENDLEKKKLQEEMANTRGYEKLAVSSALQASTTSADGQPVSVQDALGNAASQVSFSSLPINEISAQFTQKLTDMGLTTDQAKAKWEAFEKELSENTTAEEGLNRLQKELSDTADAAGGEYKQGKNKGKKISEKGKKINISKKIENEANNNAEDVKKQVEQIEELDKVNNKLSEDMINSQKKQKEGFDKVSKSISSVSTGLFAASAGLGAVGSMLSSIGAEEAANTFNWLASAASGVGMAMSLLQPILSLINFIMTVSSAVTAIKTGVDKAATKATYGQAAANVALMITCWPLLVIMLALVAALIIFVAVFAAIKKNSPEEKLKKTQEAANNAAEAADRAAEAYDNLNNSLNELDDKYKALEDLTKGTEEWNKAVRDVNKQVIDLIQKYPELAKLVKSESGVLTLDTESTEVQQILTQYEEASVAAANTSLYAQMQVDKQKASNTYDNLESGLTVWARNGENFGEEDSYDATEKRKLRTNALAQALASGDLYEADGEIKNSGKSEEEIKEEYGYSLEELEIFYKRVKENGEALEEHGEELKEYGEELLQAKEAASAMYEAMATATENLANLSMYSEQEQVEAKNLMTGDIAQQIAEDVKNEWDSVEYYKNDAGVEGIKDATPEQEQIWNKAIKQVTGDQGARFDKDTGEIVYKNSDGEPVRVEWKEFEDEIKQAAVSIQTTEEIVAATEAAPKAIDNLNKYIAGLSTTDNITEESNLGGKIYHDKASLSYNELIAVTGEEGILDEDEITKMWDALGTEGKKAYGNDKKTFEKAMKKYTIQITNNKEALEKLEEAGINTSEELKKLDTENLSALANQVEKIETASYGMEVSDEDRQKALNDYSDMIVTLLGSSDISKTQKEQAISDISSVDIYSQKALDALTARLINLYNVSQDDAIAITEQIAAISNAVDETILMIEAYGDLYKAQQLVTNSTRQLEKLQWEYSNGILKTSAEIETNFDKQISSIQDQTAGHMAGYNAQVGNLVKYYAQGATRQAEKGGASFDYRRLLDQEEFAKGNIVVDSGQYDLLTADSSFDSEIFEEWLEDLNSTAKGILEEEEAAREGLVDLRKKEEEAQDAYYELRDMTKTAVLDKMQQQIDLEQQNLDATREANDALVDKIQEQIDDTRAARELEKQQQDLNSARQQLAYLSMDTSGSNILQQQSLEKQITDQEVALGDTLVDNTLQELQDANEKAYEQRERQIALSEQALESYQNSAAFQEHVDELIDGFLSTDNIQDSDLYKMLEEGNVGMSELEKEEWAKEIGSIQALASKWTTTDWDKLQEEMYANIDALAKEAEVEQKAREAEVASLQGAGFSNEVEYTDSNGKTQTRTLNSSERTSYLNFDAKSNTKTAKENINKAQQTLGDLNIDYQTQSQYNADIQRKVASGELKLDEAKSYEEAVTGWANEATSTQGRTSTGKVYHRGDLNASKYYFDNNAIKCEIDNAIDPKIVKLGTETYPENGSTNPDIVKIVSIMNETGTPFINKGLYSLGSSVNDASYIYGEWAGTLGFRKITGRPGGMTEGNGPVQSGQELHLNQGTVFPYQEANGGAVASIDDSYKITGKSYEELKKLVDNGSKAVEKSEDGTQFIIKGSNVKAIKAYKTGGLANFTGPAWLDGTKSRPEYVLNSDQTERFFSLVDVLEGYDKDKKPEKSGDNYFEIEINVEKLENDYDVEQVADKIRRMIYEDASYRNVNAINLIR